MWENLGNTDVPNGNSAHGPVLVEENLLGREPGVHFHTQLLSLQDKKTM
jgi:hypothetical protein